MKRCEILSNVQAAIESRPKSAHNIHYLYIVNGHIKCDAYTISVQHELVVGCFPARDLDAGFSSRQWTRIEAQVAHILKLKGWLTP